MNGAVFNLPYDVQRDFEPISLLADQSFLIVGKKALPAKTLQELIAWLRANPDKAVQGTGGPGGVPHLAGLLFQKQTDTRFGLVPYRGTALAINDLVAGTSGPDDRRGQQYFASRARRHDQGLRHHRQQPLTGGDRYTHGGRSRIAELPHFQLAGAVRP